MSRTSRRSFSLIIVLLLGLWLRLLWLDASPLRGDEAFAIEYWAAPWPDGLALTSVEPHPYGTFALFALWKWLFGDGEWIMRLLPALLSIPGIAATYTLGRLLFKDTRTSLLAALLYAVHPFLIWHAQDVRNYAIWAAISPWVMVAFWQAIQTDQPRHWRRYLLLALSTAYTFFFAVFFLATQGLYVALMHRDRLRRYAITAILIVVGLIPWLLQILSIMQGSGYGGTAGGFQFDQLFTWFLPTFFFGSTLPPTIVSWLWPILAVMLATGIMLLWRRNQPTAIFVALNVTIPIVGLWAASSRMDIFRPRYLMPIAVVVVLLLAWLIDFLTTRRKPVFRVIGASMLGGIMVLNGLAYTNAHLNPAVAKAPDWRTLGSFLTTHVNPDDLVIQQMMDPSFTYYYRGPAAETGLPLRANPPAEETISYLEDAASRYRVIWLLPANVPAWDAEQVPLTWLTANMQQTANLSIAGFELLQYQRWEVTAQELPPCINAEFDGIARLCNWQIQNLGENVLRVILYWEPLQSPPPLCMVSSI